MHKRLLKTLLLLVCSFLAACLVGAGIYSRYFDDAGGALCGVQHEAIQLRNVKICHWTGVSMEVLTLLRTDVRHTGDPHKILIKYTDNVAYQCFWFDAREFDYSIDDLQPSLFDYGCMNGKHGFATVRKLRHD
jgi:hypothetical protein